MKQYPRALDGCDSANAWDGIQAGRFGRAPHPASGERHAWNYWPSDSVARAAESGTTPRARRAIRETRPCPSTGLNIGRFELVLLGHKTILPFREASGRSTLKAWAFRLRQSN